MSNTNLIVNSSTSDTNSFLKNEPSVNINSISSDTSSINNNNSDYYNSFKELLKKLFKNKTLLYSLIGFVFLILVFIIYNTYYTPTLTHSNNIKCPLDCSKYINGDININGTICKVPEINGVKCPTNCIYETEDNYVKYSDCNCDIDKPIKKPNILAESNGENVIKCPDNIFCNDCKLILKIANVIPLNPINKDLVLDFEPLKKSIYITKYYFKIHAYINNYINTNNFNYSTVKIQFINNIDKKLLIEEAVKIPNNKNNKEIIFNIYMNQPMLINSNSSIKILITNPNKDDIIIDYMSSLIIEYKNKL
jgi:hypothetical protein